MSPSSSDLHGQRDRRLRDKLRRELGSDVLAALADSAVVEIMLNADGELWVERLVSGVARLERSMSRSQAENLLGTVAAIADTEINESSPLLEVELPFDGSRFHGVVPPISAGPVFAIRKRAIRVHTLDEYVGQGVMLAWERDALCDALERRENIVICGGTGSGKASITDVGSSAGVSRSPGICDVAVGDDGWPGAWAVHGAKRACRCAGVSSHWT